MLAALHWAALFVASMNAPRPPQEYVMPSECRPGERRECPIVISKAAGPFMDCVRSASGRYVFNDANCNTPLVVSFDDEPVRFTRASGAFTIGASPRTEWVSEATPWLALDRDGSGCIESEAELFGASAGAVDGFARLALLDDNHDGQIDAADDAYARLVLWSDRDQDRRCIPTELTPLATAGVTRLELAATRRSPLVEGSYEGAWAGLTYRLASGAEATGRVIDVYLAPLD